MDSCWRVKRSVITARQKLQEISHKPTLYTVSRLNTTHSTNTNISPYENSVTRGWDESNLPCVSEEISTLSQGLQWKIRDLNMNSHAPHSSHSCKLCWRMTRDSFGSVLSWGCSGGRSETALKMKTCNWCLLRCKETHTCVFRRTLRMMQVNTHTHTLSLGGHWKCSSVVLTDILWHFTSLWSDRETNTRDEERRDLQTPSSKALS